MSLTYMVFENGRSKEVSEAKAKEFLLVGVRVEVNGPLKTIYKEVGKVFPQPEYRPTVAFPVGAGKASLYLSRPSLDEAIGYQPIEKPESTMGK